MRLSALLPAALLAVVMNACEPSDVVWRVSARGFVVDGDFQLVAACSWPKLEASQGRGIKKVDKEDGVFLALESRCGSAREADIHAGSACAHPCCLFLRATASGPAKYKHRANYERRALLQF